MPRRDLHEFLQKQKIPKYKTLAFRMAISKNCTSIPARLTVAWGLRYYIYIYILHRSNFQEQFEVQLYQEDGTLMWVILEAPTVSSLQSPTVHNMDPT